MRCTVRALSVPAGGGALATLGPAGVDTGTRAAATAAQ